jgi:hypothetical protein
MDNALTLFYSVREIDGLKKKPSTSELIDWIKLLAADRLAAGELPEIDLEENLPPYSGALIKNEADYEMLEMMRRRFRR